MNPTLWRSTARPRAGPGVARATRCMSPAPGQRASALVTIDAMGCQTKIAQAILDHGADYLLALKDNQPSLAREVALFFAAPGQAAGWDQDYLQALITRTAQ